MELKNKLVQIKFPVNLKLVILVVVVVACRDVIVYCHRCCEGPSVKQSTSNPSYCFYNVFTVLQGKPQRSLI